MSVVAMSIRLTQEEYAKLIKLGALQSVPVKPATMLIHLVRTAVAGITLGCMLLLVACDASPLQPTVMTDVNTCVATVVGSMPTDEYRALYAGLDLARVSRPTLSVTAFAREQATLYTSVPETDSRLLTFFYGDTLRALRACEVTQ